MKILYEVQVDELKQFKDMDQIENHEIVTGKIVTIFSSGFVLIKYLDNNKKGRSDFEVCKLHKLEFYNDTDALQKLSKQESWLKQEKFIIKLISNLESNSLNNQQIPPTINLFQEYEHGLVDVNIRIRNSIHNMIKSEIKFHQEELCPVKFLRCDESGNFWFQIQTCITNKLLTFMENQLPEFDSETVSSLETISSMTEIFIAPYRDESSLSINNDNNDDDDENQNNNNSSKINFQRIRIKKVTRETKTVDVEFIDFKELRNIEIENIYNCSKIDMTYAFLPSICVQGHLSGIVNLDVNQALLLFLNETVYVKLADPSCNEVEDIRNMDKVPEIIVHIHDIDDKLIELSSKLIQFGIAVPEKPLDYDKNVCRIYYTEDEDVESLPSS